MTNFQQKVFRIVRKIPRGKILTYSQVAQKLGNKKLARAVGNALNKNCDKTVPCYRVVRGDGRVGGFNRGSKKKIELLKGEGVKIENGIIIL